MSGENKLRAMQENYNVVEARSAQTYKKEFVYRVLSKELINPDISRLNKRSYEDTLIETSDAHKNGSEFFVALRQHILHHNNHVFNYVKIATIDHQCDDAGKQTVKILTLPLENVSPPLLAFQHIQCEWINNDFCRIRMFPLEAEDDHPQLSYKVNLKNGHVKRSAHQRVTHGYSAIGVWHNYNDTFPQSADKRVVFIKKIFKPEPYPLIWNKQIVSPQKSHR